MPIIYALVTRSTHVLAEYTSSGLTGNFSTVTRVLLKKIPKEDGKLSYIYDKYIFHYMVSNELTYLCMTDRDFPRVIAFQFLENIKSLFISTYGDRGKTAIAFAFNADFQRVLQQQMDRCNSTKEDKVARVRDEIDQVKNVMIQNIEKVLERGEKIELLVDKTEILDQHAFKFKKKQSRNLKRSMWWKNAKLMIVLFIIFVAVFMIVLATACGGIKLPKCQS